MNQHTTILNILDDAKFHCSNELRAAFVPEYRSRINELRKRGYTISKARCNLHTHKGISQMWRKESDPPLREFPAMTFRGKLQPGKVFKFSCCTSIDCGFKEHSRDCPTLISVPNGRLF
jgi:hypothetical protein